MSNEISHLRGRTLIAFPPPAPSTRHSLEGFRRNDTFRHTLPGIKQTDFSRPPIEREVRLISINDLADIESMRSSSFRLGPLTLGASISFLEEMHRNCTKRENMHLSIGDCPKIIDLGQTLLACVSEENPARGRVNIGNVLAQIHHRAVRLAAEELGLDSRFMHHLGNYFLATEALLTLHYQLQAPEENKKTLTEKINIFLKGLDLPYLFVITE